MINYTIYFSNFYETMSDLNLITCVNYKIGILNRLEDFVDKECTNITEDMTIDDAEGLKEGLAQLKWVEEIYKKLFKKICIIKKKYTKKIEPIMSNLKYTITNEFKTINNNYTTVDSLRHPELNIFYNDINLLYFDNWTDNQEFYNIKNCYNIKKCYK